MGLAETFPQKDEELSMADMCGMADRGGCIKVEYWCIARNWSVRLEGRGWCVWS